MLVIPQKETYSSYKCKCTATLFFAGLLGVTNGMRPQNFPKNKYAIYSLEWEFLPRKGACF